MKNWLIGSLIFLSSLSAYSSIQIEDHITDFLDQIENQSDQSLMAIQNSVLSYEYILSNEFQTYYYRNLSQKDLRQILEMNLTGYSKDLLENSTRYRSAVQIAKQAIATTEQRYKELFNLTLDLDVYLWTSLSGTDASATELNGKNSFALNMRVISRYSQEEIEIVVAHEFFHIVQYSVLDYESGNWNIKKNLMSEGWATYVSSLIFPGYPDWKYISYFKKDDTQFREFQKYQSEIVQSLLVDLESTDYSISKKYFWGRQVEGVVWPPRNGYYIGYLLAKQWAQSHSAKEVALMKWQDYSKLAKAELEKLAANSKD